ncbi:hypothetical protein PUNSTDRAFT_54971 [Punctularia strigosozonata HHB-11173 SS5]|uniref:uncharacterized protein n=1 Tax=Punctularia strigosozonata (strain HHB-11173) TaxID=741275 RepID=UPI000441862D|nr:uncharacterized protein PUNSTDRAFT_54971 [Punctularia strigosozonata HHB-11173 SS5]EIN05604.1 hypothetical protein PUNSTDRAFT_54971 [Punctularia strigosozonata HHB-11173 SS5]
MKARFGHAFAYNVFSSLECPDRHARCGKTTFDYMGITRASLVLAYNARLRDLSVT